MKKEKNISTLAREISDGFIFNNIRPEVNFHIIVRREKLNAYESIQLLNSYKSLL